MMNRLRRETHGSTFLTLDHYEEVMDLLVGPDGVIMKHLTKEDGLENFENFFSDVKFGLKFLSYDDLHVHKHNFDKACAVDLVVNGKVVPSYTVGKLYAGGYQTGCEKVYPSRTATFEKADYVSLSFNGEGDHFEYLKGIDTKKNTQTTVYSQDDQWKQQWEKIKKDAKDLTDPKVVRDVTIIDGIPIIEKQELVRRNRTSKKRKNEKKSNKSEETEQKKSNKGKKRKNNNAADSGAGGAKKLRTE